LILHRFDLALHAYDVITIKQIFVSIEKIKKKMGEKMHGILFFSFLGMSDIACTFA
jgi:hypothetical protein